MRIKKRRTPDNRLIQHREEGSSTDNELPSFCFKFLQQGHDFAAFDNKDDHVAFSHFIAGIACLTWRELKQAPRTGVGYEKIAHIAVRKPNGLEYKNFIAFRACGIMRVIGFRERQTLYIVWIDRKGKVYTH